VAWSLRLQGVGNAFATELGSAMATIERDGAPWLTIDCGNDGLTHYLAQYGAPPRALFITHAHLDHVGGFERLFGAAYWNDALRGRIALYVPAPLVPLLQQRVASYPNVIAEGGANFWDAFRLVPVGDHFWHDGVRLEVFPTRHH
jgi:glyoxylase-like metal-dependent hydrolase (beta-lactamase superfamily II)